MWAGCLGFCWSQQSSEAWFRCFSIVAERHACQQLHLQKDPGLQYGMPYIALDILHTTGFLWIWQQGSFPDIHGPSTHVDFSIPAPEHSPPYLNGQKSIGMKGLQEDTSCVTLSWRDHSHSQLLKCHNLAAGRSKQREYAKEVPKHTYLSHLSICPFPSQLGLPLCTWPFCFSALLFLLITSDNPAIYKIPLCKVTYPEANRIYYLRMKRRASESRREEQKRKEQKPSGDSKISTGGTPLCTPKNSRNHWFQAPRS